MGQSRDLGRLIHQAQARGTGQGEKRGSGTKGEAAATVRAGDNERLN